MRTRVAMSIVCLALLAGVAPAEAQYAVRGTSDRATGENYRIEIGGYFWNPTPEIVIASEGLGQLGDNIDFVTTLGIQKKTFKQLKVVLRPATKHKFRFEYTPIGGLLIRARTRSESALPDGSGGRVVSVTTLGAIEVGGGGR